MKYFKMFKRNKRNKRNKRKKAFICPFMSSTDHGFISGGSLTQIPCLKEKCMGWNEKIEGERKCGYLQRQ